MNEMIKQESIQELQMILDAIFIKNNKRLHGKIILSAETSTHSPHKYSLKDDEIQIIGRWYKLMNRQIYC